MATADVPQMSVVVVMGAQFPVGLHGGEAVVAGLQRVNPDGPCVHSTEQQLPVGAMKHQKKKIQNSR